jgi:hypothetical protein
MSPFDGEKYAKLKGLDWTLWIRVTIANDPSARKVTKRQGSTESVLEKNG